MSFENFEFTGPTLDFVAFRGTNGFSNGVESGSFIYNANGSGLQEARNGLFFPSNDDDFPTSRFDLQYGWPDDDEDIIAGTYTYSILGESSGIIQLSAAGTTFYLDTEPDEDGDNGTDNRSFLSGIDTSPATLTVIYDTDGTAISMGTAVFDASPDGEMATPFPSVIVETQFPMAGEESPLFTVTETEEDVPFRYGTDYDSYSEVIPISLDGGVYTFTDDSGNFFLRTLLSESRNEGGRFTEFVSSGIAATTDSNLITYESAPYEVTTTEGTDTALIDLDFSAAPAGSSLPSNLEIEISYSNLVSGVFTATASDGTVTKGFFDFEL